MIEKVVNKLNDLTEHREVNWAKNFAFKENLDNDIKIFDGLLENKPKLR